MVDLLARKLRGCRCPQELGGGHGAYCLAELPEEAKPADT